MSLLGPCGTTGFQGSARRVGIKREPMGLLALFEIGAGVRILEIAAKKVPFRHWRRPAVSIPHRSVMRTHGVPTLSMHDGLIVPKSKADLAKNFLTIG